MPIYGTEKLFMSLESTCNYQAYESFGFVKSVFGTEISTCFWTEVKFHLLSIGYVFCPLCLVYSNTAWKSKRVWMVSARIEYEQSMCIRFIFALLKESVAKLVFLKNDFIFLN